MIKNRTVLILGAGASVDYCYPTGDGLVAAIKDRTDVNKWQNAMRKLGVQETQDFQKIHNCLLRQSPINIDKFLRQNPDLEEVTKQLIAVEILLNEKKHISLIKEAYPDAKHPLPKENRLRENWYRFIVDNLTAGCKKPKDIHKNKLSVVTFNYDMSLEYYLLESLSGIFGIKFFIDEAINFVKNLDIIHVYGQIRGNNYEREKLRDDYAKLLICSDSKSGINETDHFISLFNEAKKLKTNIHVINEIKQNENKNQPHVKKAIEQIKKAEKILILGFGFDDFNVDLLGLKNLSYNPRLPHPEHPNKKIFCTNYNNIPIIEKNIYRCFACGSDREEFDHYAEKALKEGIYIKNFINIANTTVYKAFEQHWSLTDNG